MSIDLELTTTVLIDYALGEGIFHEPQNLFSMIPWTVGPFRQD